MWSLKMKNRTSGCLSASHFWTGLYPSKIGAQTASFCLLVSSAKPIVGVWEEAIPPTMVAIKNSGKTRTTGTGVQNTGRASRGLAGRANGPLYGVAACGDRPDSQSAE